MATRIGCDRLTYAIMTTEDTESSLPVYGAVKAAPGVMSITINPNATQDSLFADDGPMDSATTLGKVEVEIKKNELTTVNKSDLLGHEIDSKGAVVSSATDIPPYVAVGFRALKSNGKYKYTWLLKGKFTEPEEQNETKGDSINFQADTISGQFLKLNYKHTVNGSTKQVWKYEINEDYSEADSTLIASWFSDVQMPS